MRPPTDRLVLYTVFDRPADWPQYIVVRPSALFTDHGPLRWPYIVPSDAGPFTGTHAIACLCPDLETARAPFVGCWCQPRQPGDEPQIVEVWL